MNTIILSLLKKYWKQLLAIGAALTIIMLTRELFVSNSNAARFKNNYEVVNGNLQKALILKTGELKQAEPKIDSLSKLLGIRDKTIQSIFQTKYNYNSNFNIPGKRYDTSFVKIPVLKDSILYSTITIPKEFTINKSCYDINFIANDDTIDATLQFHDQLTGFINWERPHKFLFFYWGDKKYFMKIYSACRKDTVSVDKFIIIQ